MSAQKYACMDTRSRTTNPKEDKVDKIIGKVTEYTGTEFGFLRKIPVKIIAVFKGAANPERDEYEYIDDDDALERAGGISAQDRVEVAPWIVQEGRFSFATSDPLAKDLAYLAGKLAEVEK